jgi:hypothetical protein
MDLRVRKEEENGKTLIKYVHNFDFPRSIISMIKSRIRWGIEEIRNEYIIIIGPSEGKRPLAKSMSRGEDNIKMILRIQDCLQWGSLVNTVINEFH